MNQIKKSNIKLEKRIVNLEELRKEFNSNLTAIYDLSNNQKIDNIEDIRRNIIYKFINPNTNETILYIAY